jgi:hypothetical protein
MRHQQDVSFVALAALHGAVLLLAPVAPLIAVGVWWNSNTIAHNFVHRPFFRAKSANTVFSVYQSLLLGIPQTLWRQRHLAHHANVSWQWQWSGGSVVEVVLILLFWGGLVAQWPMFFVWTYLPGYAVGLGLCAIQGHYEHVGGVTTSHYGRVYNLLCFNDGYHGEHHAFPGVPWSKLPDRRHPGPRVSRWPPLLRWLDRCSLNGLELMVLRSPRLQRFVVAAHVRALAPMLSGAGTIRRVAIVGGGLFPRTALVLRKVLPDARLVIIDRERTHLELAQRFIDALPADERPDVELRHRTFVAGDRCEEFDLVVVPLAFDGDRQGLCANPPAPLLLSHDWVWRAHGCSRLVSIFLLKRLNLIRR